MVDPPTRSILLFVVGDKEDNSVVSSVLVMDVEENCEEAEEDCVVDIVVDKEDSSVVSSVLVMDVEENCEEAEEDCVVDIVVVTGI